MALDDPKDIVRRGYDAVSLRYDEAYGADKYEPWLSDLANRIPTGGSVLEVGCGSGVPVASALVGMGLQVTGVDFSEVQVRRARQRVPQATFIRSDATTVDFPASSFDAVVSFYTVIHIPLKEQLPLFTKIAGWLRPEGWFLGTAGSRAWTGTEENWLGGGAAMWWSHADAKTYRRWLSEAGLVVERDEYVLDSQAEAEAGGGHTLFWARRPNSS